MEMNKHLIGNRSKYSIISIESIDITSVGSKIIIDSSATLSQIFSKDETLK